MKKRLIIIDLSSFIFRAFYGVRMLNAPDGTPVNSLHGILGMFLKMFAEFRPTHLILAKDTKGGTFRNEIYPEYKANRGEPPEELIPQFPLISEMLEKMGIKSLSNDQYEADDIIGSLTTQWKDEFDEILLASSDKDLMQLIGGPVKMLDTMKAKIYDRDGVFEKMGVYPEQIIDFLAMMGDSSDNVPGMRGIGAKGAAKLLAEHQSLKKCIEVKDTFKGKKLTTAFTDYLDDGLLSKELVTIKTNIQVSLNPEDTIYQFYPSEQLFDFLKKLGFKSALKKLETIKEIEDSLSLSPPSNDTNQSDQDQQLSLLSPKNSQMISGDDEIESLLNIEHKNLTWLENEVSKFKELSFYFYQDDLALASSEKDIFILNLNLNKGDRLKALELLLGSKINLLGFNLKELIKESEIYSNCNVNCCLHDLSLKQFLISHQRKNDFQSLVFKYFEKDFDQSKFALNASYIFSINNIINRLLKENELENVYLKLDQPTIKTLAYLEKTGIICDKVFLKKLEDEYDQSLIEVETQIRSFSNNPELNLNSPKQLSEFLFTELKLPSIKKTKTGFSTDSEVLSTLQRRKLHIVPELLLQYRELNKLLSTYVKTLPLQVVADSENNNRIHPTFNIDGAATGRLSCTDPNLQNIPIRTPLGSAIRKGFIAPKGKIFLGADYSQIELRLLAHFSMDPILIKTFKDGGDIHLQTASEVLAKETREVSKAERSSAKAVNFGLMYGQGAFGLSKQLNISRSEAKNYIEKYFSRFSKIKSFLETLKDFAHEYGYVETLCHRKRFIPQIDSANKMELASAERIAINSPIQGTAADLIKLAMNNIYQKLIDGQFESKMILQIHDELIFEVEKSELKELEMMVRSEMESVFTLCVPLIVEIHSGADWFSLK